MLGRLLATILILSVSSPVTAAETVYPVAAVRADFAALYDGLKEAHYDLYAHRSKAEYDRLHAEMLRGLDRPMTKAEVEERFQRFAAYGRIAHAVILSEHDGWEAYRKAGGRAFPFQIRPVGDRVYVGEMLTTQTGVTPGDELLSIDGRQIAEWIERVSRSASADTPYMTGALLEASFPRRLWLEVGPREAFDISVRKPDGESATLRMPATTRNEAAAAEAARPAAFALNPETREARMLAGGVAYLKPGPFYNVAPGAPDMWDSSTYIPFIDRAFEDFIAAGATDLLVDLRDNPGGDNSFSDPMIAWFAQRPFRFYSRFEIKVSPQTTASNQARLDISGAQEDGASARMAALYAGARNGSIVTLDLPFAQPRPGKRFTGRVWLLINRHSYSNTVTVAALVQDYGLGTVLGEETSDMATTYGAMETFALPRTGVKVGYPKALIIRPNGDRRARGVTPDIAIPSPIAPAAEDEVLKSALAIVRKR
ncbi:S41 family peptidase [Caulobacter mirabilis]|uniref:Tail specific protease domain-containing protein n=1 Tax=Caulobacter mirabilis TaxID=69666 RepID=A0A2D2AU99_9CAUL|nr:S41 family peptidase [Caulobacter mirabilis]ATQ41547.1 hypothetical protein CSW64_03525 [Caulobacter mirabilis]